ncbi:MAG: family 10 glycosylhydrolase [Oscillospiraceae bacterium]
MKRKIQRLLCIFAAAVMMSGCASQQSAQSSDNSIQIIDAGGSSGVVKQQEPPTDAEPVSSADDTSAAQPTEQHTTRTTEQTRDTSPVTEPREEQTATTKQTTTTTVTENTTVTSSEKTTASSVSASGTTAQSTTVKEPTPPAEDFGDFGTNSYKALNHSEVQGVWMSYLEYSDMMTGRSEAQFRENIAGAFDNCIGLGLNTVYVHARSHGDAYYKSELFPWSRYASGSINKAPGYDPLQIIIEEAHKRGISVQAWINPLRLCSVSDMASYGDYTVSHWYADGSVSGKYLAEVSGYYYLNPAYEEVTDFIATGAAEIASKYDVDGLHIDDYFYPTTEAWFDSAAFAESGYTNLSEFRLDNCDRLVESIYAAVKSANPTALFSVSCQGSIENNYDKMYADVEKWCTQKGYLDYIVPQIYYGFDNSTQPYLECLSRWERMACAGGIPLVVGLSVYKIGTEDKWAGAGSREWLTDSAILSRQLEAARECTSYGGAALYSYRSIYSCDSSVEAQIWEEIALYTQLIK